MNTKNQIIIVVTIIGAVVGGIVLIAVLNASFLNMNEQLGLTTFKLTDEPLPLVQPQLKQEFMKGYNEAEQQQKLALQKTAKDCPAIQHLHSGVCVNNADNKEHGSTFNKSRSSTLDCASNEFICKSEGIE
jgi:hypothetical protein